MTEQPAFRVFLSYSTKDRRNVREIYKHLAQSKTVVPWFDDKILLPGLEWEREISKAIWGTDVVLICFSPRALTGRGELDDEIRYALAVAEKRGKAKPPLVVLKLEQCELPPLLHDVPTVNWYEKNWDEQLEEVLQAQEIPQRPPPATAPTPAGRSGQKNGQKADASKADPSEASSREQPASTTEGKKPAQQGQGRGSRRDPQEQREFPRKPQTTPRGRATTTPSPTGKPWLRYIAGGAISLVIIAAVVLLWREGPGLLADEGMNGNGPVATFPPTSTEQLSPALLETSEPFVPAPQSLPTKVTTATTTFTPTTPTTPITLTTMPIPTLPLTPTAAITPTATAVPTPPPPPTPTLPLTPTVVITPTATPVPTPSPTPPPPPPPTTYTVQSGDTFSGIASEYGLSVAELLQLNNMAPEEADNIRPGQEIIVSR